MLDEAGLNHREKIKIKENKGPAQVHHLASLSKFFSSVK